MELRPATTDDVPLLATLVRAYFEETEHRPWFGAEELLAEDLRTGAVAVRLAADELGLVGFAAVVPTYDLRNCVPGARVLDLFVARERRGGGVAAALLCAVAADAMGRGAVFLEGRTGTGPVARLYGRVGRIEGGSVVVGGRAFRQLAALASRPPRAVLAGLPPVAWNHE
jgi:GNAT superfamily N-acetyltransferase